MAADFTLAKSGLVVTVTNRSTLVPSGSTYQWDFGDSTPIVTDENPAAHTYSSYGVYSITLTITPPPTAVPLVQVQSIVLSDLSQTQLSGSIYDLIDSYIPDELVPTITYKDKRVYIEKWQLYIQPLVNHDVPLQQYNNELYYEALENQLIMELAAYDWLNIGIMNLLRSVSNTVQDSTSGSETAVVTATDNQGIKKIVTGPTEVEYYEGVLDGESASSLAKTVTTALKPGGFIDNIRINICMLASRLEIYLPICDKVYKQVVPTVVNRRRPGLLGGPNPTFPLNK